MTEYYLNTASQTPVKTEVLETIVNTLKKHWYNPSDKFENGINSKQVLDEAVKTIAESINAEPEQIVICASGSMANNLAINGYLQKQSAMLVTTNIEHSSIKDIKCPYYDKLQVGKNGIIDPKQLEDYLHRQHLKSFIVSIQYANNELGTIQPIKEMVDITHSYNGVFHCDATQYFPYYKINVKELNVDFMTVSGHKLGAPSGIAFLYVKNRKKLKPMVFGEQDSLVAGTENLAYINGLAEAIKLINYNNTRKIEGIRNYFEDKVLRSIPDTYINGSIQNRTCHISNICFKGCDAETLQTLLDIDGILCSTGSACNSGNKEPSFVLTALGLSESDLTSCLRFSFDENLSNNDIDTIVEKLKHKVMFVRTSKL